MAAPHDKKMLIEYDENLRSYYIVWNPTVALGLGRTKKKALEDLRAAAHLGIDTTIDTRMGEIDRKEGKW
jgi:hypothetical protein